MPRYIQDESGRYFHDFTGDFPLNNELDRVKRRTGFLCNPHHPVKAQQISPFKVTEQMTVEELRKNQYYARISFNAEMVKDLYERLDKNKEKLKAALTGAFVCHLDLKEYGIEAEALAEFYDASQTHIRNLIEQKHPRYADCLKMLR